ncbi:MAG TPA: hypothetical protein VNJ01_10700 [Bacteriovoracaceae bacterium]|nr:hypothetical protein [Bacteriovoracaceae bacterium]
MNETLIFEETGARLNLLTNAILIKWESLVRQAVVEADKENPIILLDHMPQILEHLGVILKSGVIDPIKLSKAHGFQRVVLTDYSLEDVFKEYSFLRETLIDYLYPIGNMSCTKLIHSYLDLLCRNSVIEYVRHLQLPGRPQGPASEKMREESAILPLVPAKEFI